MITVSVDEKPGVQAIGNMAPDLQPVAGKIDGSRDHEYIRYGTVSILAALDLHDGTSPRALKSGTGAWSSSRYCEIRDAEYHRPECTIRVVLDSHSAHISKVTRAYLATRPNRFKYVLTPAHGSWLNIVETLFGKMTRTFLRQIQVGLKKELKERILLGIAEINEMPIVHRWKAFEALQISTESGHTGSFSQPQPEHQWQSTTVKKPTATMGSRWLQKQSRLTIAGRLLLILPKYRTTALSDSRRPTLVRCCLFFTATYFEHVPGVGSSDGLPR